MSKKAAVADIWAQCENANCGKWRLLPPGTVVDESTPWYCYMNPDPEHNTCEAPEVAYDESEDVLSGEGTTGADSDAAAAQAASEALSPHHLASGTIGGPSSSDEDGPDGTGAGGRGAAGAGRKRGSRTGGGGGGGGGARGRPRRGVGISSFEDDELDDAGASSGREGRLSGSSGDEGEPGADGLGPRGAPAALSVPRAPLPRRLAAKVASTLLEGLGAWDGASAAGTGAEGTSMVGEEVAASQPPPLPPLEAWRALAAADARLAAAAVAAMDAATARAAGGKGSSPGGTGGQGRGGDPAPPPTGPGDFPPGLLPRIDASILARVALMIAAERAMPTAERGG